MGIFLVFLMGNFMENLMAATISGVVSEAESGEKIPFTNVLLKGTEVGTISNNEGYFVLSKIRPGNYTVYVSAISHLPQEVELKIELGNEDRFLKIELERSSFKMEGIEVTGNKFEEMEMKTPEIALGNFNLRGKMIEEIPQAGDPDVLRSIQALPGVTSSSDFSSGLYVRGGSPDQNLILLDETDVYNPNHFGGVFSTFNSDAISNIKLIKGGFPARYGDRLSSVLDISNLDGNRKKHEGTARLSLLSSGVTLQGPWNIKDKQGSYMASFRRTYLELVKSAFDLDIPDYYFYDGHAKLNLDISATDKLTTSIYFGNDRMRMDDGVSTDLGWGNQTLSSQWTHLFNPYLFSRFVVAGSHFGFDLGMNSDSDESVTQENNIYDLTLKGMFNYKPSEKSIWDFGVELKSMEVKFESASEMDIDQSHYPDFDVPSYLANIYAQNSYQLGGSWTIQPGLRTTYCHTISKYLDGEPASDYLKFSPRFSIRKELNDFSSISANYGRYYQFITSIYLDGFPMGLWFPLDGSVDPLSADHYILSYKAKFNEFALEAEVYYKNYNHIVEFDENMWYEWDANEHSLSDAYLEGEGYSYGLDLLLRTELAGMNGFISYSYGISKRKLDDHNLNPETGEPEWFAPTFDRTHQLTVVQTYDYSNKTGMTLLGAEVKLGSSFNLQSGQPTSYPEKVYWDEDGLQYLSGYEDSNRLPIYSRLDLNLRFLWQFDDWSIEPFLQAVNILGAENVWQRSYEPGVSSDGSLEINNQDTTMFPRIPFLGVNVKW